MLPPEDAQRRSMGRLLPLARRHHERPPSRHEPDGRYDAPSRRPDPASSAHPVYVDLLPPCNTPARPARTSRPGWRWRRPASYREAWETLVRDNPLPAVHGRVCYHPCETACNRGELDARGQHPCGRAFPRRSRRRGGLAHSRSTRRRPASACWSSVPGPSGLSAAYHLARLGHTVEIHEAGPLAGGMMHFGIPAYRLPRADLMREIRRIEAMGVKIVLNHKVEDVLAEMAAGRFDAVFVAIGADVGKHVDIPARDAVRVLDAVSLLHDVGDRRGAAAGPPRGGLRRRQHRDGCGAHRAAPGRRRSADRLPPRPRPHAGACASRRTRRSKEGIKIKWLTTHQGDHRRAI